LIIKELKFMHEQLKTFVRARTNVDEFEMEYISRYFHLETYNKGDLLVDKSEVCEYVYFVNKGAVRAFYLSEDDVQSTTFIVLENMFCSSLASFIQKKPSFEYLEAIENLEVLRVKREDFYFLLTKSPAIERIYRIILEQLQIFNMWRVELLISKDAKVKYDMLWDDYPQLFGRIPNKIIASYIGIRAETLSRIMAAK
jgi:CRP-like cAMP-binding protein